MYSDVFSLGLLSKEYNYSNSINNIKNVIKFSRQGLSLDDNEFYYPIHFTEKVIELFDKNDLK